MRTTRFVLLILIMMNRSFTYTFEEYPVKSSNHPHSRIKLQIFMDYDPNVRPVANHLNATMVTVRMVLKGIDYDMLTNTIDVHSWLAISWNDEHLKWNQKDFDNVDTIYAHTMEIWTPDLSIYNARDQSSDPSVMNELTCSISSDGIVTCVPPVKNTAHCRAKLRRYPYDKQKCSVTLGSWVYTGEEVNFTFREGAVLTDEYTPNDEWELQNISTKKNPGHYDCCPNNTYPSLIYTFFLKRHPGFHAATVAAPALVLMITTLLTFFLNPAGMDRFCLACLNVIIHLLHLQFIAWSLPSFGDEIPLIVEYSRNSLVLCTFALVYQAILKRLVDKPEESPTWISNAITCLLGSCMGQFLLVCNYSLKNLAAAKNEEDGTNIIIDTTENNKHRDCLLFAKISDRVCLLVFFIAYFCMFVAFIPEG